MKVNLVQPDITSDEIDAVCEVLKSGQLAQGPKVQLLEEQFAVECGSKYAIAFNSGTAAIHAGLYSLGLKVGEEVITTPFTFVATANPILMQGGKVVFADISEDDFNISPESVEKKINENTKAIIPVDLYGKIHRYKEISQIASEHNIDVLVDSCQSVGAQKDGIKSGVMGKASAFSLYATKNITSGEGGILTTNDEEVCEKCKMFRHHGQSEKTRYEYFDIGYNYRMTDFAAAMALVQLGKLRQYTAKRNAHARLLSDGLRDLEGVILPRVENNEVHSYHQYTIRITESFPGTRDDLKRHLESHGISSGIYYPKPLHLHPHFKRMGYSEGDFPIAEKIATQVLSLPVHPLLSVDQINYIVENIHGFSK